MHAVIVINLMMALDEKSPLTLGYQSDEQFIQKFMAPICDQKLRVIIWEPRMNNNN